MTEYLENEDGTGIPVPVPRLDQLPLKHRQFLDTYLQDTDLWENFVTVVDEAVDAFVTHARRQLQTKRQPDKYRHGDVVRLPDGRRGIVSRIIMRSPSKENPNGEDVIVLSVEGKKVEFESSALLDRDLLRSNAGHLGFDFLSPLLTDEDYYRINKFVGQYWPTGGTEGFVNFMAYIKNIRLEIRTLWSHDTYEDDYKVFVPPDERGTAVYEKEIDASGKEVAGKWYPTSHVDLVYEAEKYDLHVHDVVSLFYLLAPIHLVLLRIYSHIEAHTTYKDGDAEFRHGLNVGGACGLSSAYYGPPENPDPEHGDTALFAGGANSVLQNYSGNENPEAARGDSRLFVGGGCGASQEAVIKEMPSGDHADTDLFYGGAVAGSDLIAGRHRCSLESGTSLVAARGATSPQIHEEGASFWGETSDDTTVAARGVAGPLETVQGVFFLAPESGATYRGIGGCFDIQQKIDLCNNMQKDTATCDHYQGGAVALVGHFFGHGESKSVQS